MNRRLLVPALLVLWAVPQLGVGTKPATRPAGAAPADAPAGAPGGAAPSPPPLEQPDVPTLKLLRDGTPDPKFLRMHEDFAKTAKDGKARLVFIGDSITEGWKRYPALWDKAFGAYEPANFGIGWDRTQYVLWRVSNGELDGLAPKVIVLLIGTNNTGPDDAEAIARGITKIVEAVHGKLPAAKVLLLGIFPRGEKPGRNPARDKIKQVNALISKLDDGGRTVRYLDIGNKFLQPDGTIARQVMPEFLHPTEKGYQIWADAIAQPLQEMMRAN